MRTLSLVAAGLGGLGAIALVALAASRPPPAVAERLREGRAFAAPQLGHPADRASLADEPDPAPEPKPKPPPASVAAPTPTPAAPRPAAPLSAAAAAMAPPSPAAVPTLALPPPDAEATVRNTIRQSVGAFESCYQSSLRRDSRIRGRIVVSVNALANGKVVSAKLDETTIKDDGVIGCITNRLKTLRFPPLGEDVQVTLPLSLVPRED